MLEWYVAQGEVGERERGEEGYCKGEVVRTDIGHMYWLAHQCGGNIAICHINHYQSPLVQFKAGSKHSYCELWPCAWHKSVADRHTDGCAMCSLLSAFTSYIPCSPAYTPDLHHRTQQQLGNHYIHHGWLEKGEKITVDVYIASNIYSDQHTIRHTQWYVQLQITWPW